MRTYAGNWLDRNGYGAVNDRAYQLAGLTPQTTIARIAPTSGEVRGAIDAAAARFPKLQAIIDALQGR